jgi:methyl-accepting chemotaxis protein
VAKSLSESGKILTKQWNQLDAEHVKLALEQIVSAAHSIENASNYQKSSNQKLETALKVTTQVTEQLAFGATSATEAATQLEQVVDRLRRVVGN